ncbi:MAG: GNAT family N-acetyltransferase [Treponema sp.]|jgi:ribosomal protein S18 acetylase RimI-like enzyme|nr:GNAT family N-acetyltransferase [Treponema sp.]
MTELLRWRKMKKQQIAETELLLQSQERWCMNACNRYINRNKKEDNVWLLRNKAGNFFALVVHAKQSLLPVLCGQENIPPLHFLRGLFGTVPIHSLQGKKEDVLIMEGALEKIGLYAAEKIDFDLMCIDNPPAGFSSVRPVGAPPGLIIRKPQSNDMNALAALQAAYEQEEVVPSASEFNAAVSRLNTERIFSKEQMLVAELGGRLIGKINTNAAVFFRYQVGGVYVHPDYRGRGIGGRMAGEFITSLVAQGKGISLFVKKSNLCARRVYQRIGFEILGDYRIDYF